MKIDDLLLSLKNEKVYYKSNPGNGGDALITYAAFCLFKKNNIEYQIINGEEDLKDKVLMYAGGGNLVSLYNDCSDFIEKHHKKAKKLIVLPHTVSGHENLLKTLGANVYIVCREQTSYDYVKKFKNINCLKIKDLAFNIDIKKNINLQTNKKRLLYLAKTEGILLNILNGSHNIKFYLKSYKNQKKLNAFRVDSEKTFDVPNENVDVSAVINFDYSMMDEKKVMRTANAIFSFLNQFEEIYTNRLHICIAGALLNKVVYFYGNSYWKNESVFEYSINGVYLNVKWMGYEFE